MVAVSCLSFQGKEMTALQIWLLNTQLCHLSRWETVEISDIANLPQAPELIERPSSLNSERIVMGQRLTDEDIINAQKVLRAQFPKLNGFRLTLYQDKPQSGQAIHNWIQIIHC